MENAEPGPTRLYEVAELEQPLRQIHLYRSELWTALYVDGELAEQGPAFIERYLVAGRTQTCRRVQSFRTVLGGRPQASAGFAKNRLCRRTSEWAVA